GPGVRRRQAKPGAAPRPAARGGPAAGGRAGRAKRRAEGRRTCRTEGSSNGVGRGGAGWVRSVGGPRSLRAASPFGGSTPTTSITGVRRAGRTRSTAGAPAGRRPARTRRPPRRGGAARGSTARGTARKPRTAYRSVAIREGRPEGAGAFPPSRGPASAGRAAAPARAGDAGLDASRDARLLGAYERGRTARPEARRSIGARDEARRQRSGAATHRRDPRVRGRAAPRPVPRAPGAQPPDRADRHGAGRGVRR